jgi:MoxR-like ATPase
VCDAARDESADERLLSPSEAQAARALALRLCAELDRALLGQSVLTALVVTAFLARGHCLLVGLPWLGMTELVMALARFSGLVFRRLQFTPDLLPGDVTGGHLLQ